MENYGLVRFEQGPNRQLVPHVNYSGVELEMPFYSGSPAAVRRS